MQTARRTRTPTGSWALPPARSCIRPNDVHWSTLLATRKVSQTGNATGSSYLTYSPCNALQKPRAAVCQLRQQHATQKAAPRPFAGRHAHAEGRALSHRGPPTARRPTRSAAGALRCHPKAPTATQPRRARREQRRLGRAQGSAPRATHTCPHHAPTTLLRGGPGVTSRRGGPLPSAGPPRPA